MNDTVDEQVAVFMQSSEFGDPQIKESMIRELRARLLETRAQGRPLPDLHLDTL